MLDRGDTCDTPSDHSTTFGVTTREHHIEHCDGETLRSIRPYTAVKESMEHVSVGCCVLTLLTDEGPDVGEQYRVLNVGFCLSEHPAEASLTGWEYDVHCINEMRGVWIERDPVMRYWR
jgi:hypothetical protein